MKVLNSKDIASHAGPESCVTYREVRDEALTGEPAGQPLSRESLKLVQGADAVSVAEGNTDRNGSASAWLTLRGLRTWHVGYALCTGTGRSPTRPLQMLWSGPHREGEESKPMKHGQEKSDLFIVAPKPANKPG